MDINDNIKWLESLKQQIGQSQHSDLWHFEQVIDETIDNLKPLASPHGRLIDADDIYNKFKNEYCNRNCVSSVQGKKCDHCGVPRALNIILNSPTIIEAEVSE
jgi:hypothetical protein